MNKNYYSILFLIYICALTRWKIPGTERTNQKKQSLFINSKFYFGIRFTIYIWSREESNRETSEKHECKISMISISVPPTRTFEHCETSVRISYLFQYSQIQIDRHDPRSLRWIRSFVAVHVYFFHASLASSFIPSRGNISFTEQSFEEILMKWNFLLKEIKKLNEGMIKILEEITEEYIFSFLIIIIISLKRWYSTKMNILDYFPYFRQIPWKLL